MKRLIDNNDVILRDVHLAMADAVIAREDSVNEDDIALCEQMKNVYLQIASVLMNDQNILTEKVYRKNLQGEEKLTEDKPTETNPPEEKQEAKAEVDETQTAKKPAKKKAK